MTNLRQRRLPKDGESRTPHDRMALQVPRGRACARCPLERGRARFSKPSDVRTRARPWRNLSGSVVRVA